MTNLNIVLVGRGPLTLRESNYVTSGGEGAIYRAGDTVIKIYAKPDKMIADGMPDKIALLSKIKHASIVVPTNIVLDASGAPIGFYMPMIDGEPMPRVFTTDYRVRTGFDDVAARRVTAQMWDATWCAHDNHALMVDANEFNWIVGADFAPKVIDVDSWAIGRWPATVIMPSIRDWRAKKFDALSDWFSWGVVAFQVFTGIHPFKGRLDGYKPGEFERRMRDGASVFAPGVRLPASARDPSCIPAPLLQWFHDEFQDGARTAPPSPATEGLAPRWPSQIVMRTVVGDSSGLIHQKVYDNPNSRVIRTWPCGVALLENGDAVDMERGELVATKVRPSDEVVRDDGAFLVARAAPPLLLVKPAVGAPEMLPPGGAHRFFRSDNRLFAVTEAELVEVGAARTDRGYVRRIGHRWGVRRNATQFFDGVAVQDVLGAAFLLMPVGNVGMVQVKVRELDGLTPVAGVGLNRFASVLAADKAGAYHRVEVTLSASYGVEKVWTGPNDGPDLNMVAMPSGAVATIVDDGEVVIFVPVNGNVRRVADAGATTAIRLSRWGSRVTYVKDGAVWSMRTK